MRFLCEVKVPSIAYIGAGNSTNKKDAEKNAARDFLNYLIRIGKVNSNELPVEETGGAVASAVSDNNDNGGFQRPQQQANVFQVCTLFI